MASLDNPPPSGDQVSRPKRALRDYLTARNLRVTVWLVGIMLVSIVVGQNWHETETRILFMEIRMRAAWFGILLLLTGFVLGLLTPRLWHRRQEQEKNRD